MDRTIWRSGLLGGRNGLYHGTASRAFGRLSFRTGETPEAVGNRERLACEAGFSLASVTMVRQVHGACVRLIAGSDIGNGAHGCTDLLPECDAMVSAEPGATLVVRTNDCVPVLLYDRCTHAIGAAHAGWKGVLGGVVAHTVVAMTASFGSRPTDLFAALGPSIRGCHYDVGTPEQDRARQFLREYVGIPGVICERSGHVFVDLAHAVRVQLLSYGLCDSHIDICPDCTYERHAIWPSRRANGGKPTGLSTWSYIGRAPSLRVRRAQS
jgi:polyphenol oxidase